jgi:hypothetical protein
VSIYAFAADALRALAVSAWREVPLGERKQPAFPDQMLKYAKAREHCLVETGQILPPP